MRLYCSDCGTETDAKCNCGKAYVPKSVRAAEYAEQNPRASVREIAKETGVGHGTAQEAKAHVRTAVHLDDAVTVGRDGKSYPATKPAATTRPLRNRLGVLIGPTEAAIEQICELFEALAPADRGKVQDRLDKIREDETSEGGS